MAKNVFCGLQIANLRGVNRIEFRWCVLSIQAYCLYLNLTTKKEAIYSLGLLAHAYRLVHYYEPKYHIV
jgi:hypothetical protein